MRFLVGVMSHKMYWYRQRWYGQISITGTGVAVT